MNRAEYLQLMQFPEQWEQWDMIPNAWCKRAMASYEPGMENASEHDRNGAFQWWLKKSPDTERLILLAKLAALDPDSALAESVSNDIRASANFTPEVEIALSIAT